MMPDMIRDGQGKGFLAGVDGDNRLRVSAKTESLQHLISQEKNESYQCIGTATLANDTVVILHIKNISNNKEMVITYIRHQIINPDGGTALPNVSNYYKIALRRTYVSGGIVATPVNVWAGSGNAADVTAYQGGPILEGTAQEIDRQYTKESGDMNIFNKEGAVIIPPNETIELSYVSDQTSGTIYTRISFLMEEVK